MTPVTIVSDATTRRRRRHRRRSRAGRASTRCPPRSAGRCKPEGLCRDDVVRPGARPRLRSSSASSLDLAAVADALGRPDGRRRRRRHRGRRARPGATPRRARRRSPRPTSTLRDLDGERALARPSGAAEAAAARVLLLVRLPLRPARVAGAAGRARATRTSPSSRSRSTSRPTTCARGPPRASPCRCSSTRSTCSPRSTRSATCPRSCGSTRTTASCGPNGVAFSNDMFKEFTGVESGPHLDAVRGVGARRHRRR